MDIVGVFVMDQKRFDCPEEALRRAAAKDNDDQKPGLRLSRGYLLKKDASMLNEQHIINGVIYKAQQVHHFVCVLKIMLLHWLPVKIMHLHWLPVRQRIEYKLLLLTFNSLNGLAALYLAELLSRHQPTRSLRSADANLLVEPRSNLKTQGDRAFSHAAPRLWNNLPLAMHVTDSHSEHLQETTQDSFI